MALLYPPALGTILLCDYSIGGAGPPEMVKRRPAVVVSPRLRHRGGLCSLVPLSTTAPRTAVDYVVPLTLEVAPPTPFDARNVWAKCDMLSCASFARLDLFRCARSSSGKRRYLKLRVDEQQMSNIRIGILAGLGISRSLEDQSAIS
ncbi:type II toxin-antitoxin system PemK/MazF family toxin [Maricaulis sp.]|uniref:type II toxin-antitoxin system PemK/MazF family toxin n=1 Tax=Maricaulis sp. TaxID=1486257 RepID=UPI003A911F0C